MSTSNDMCFSRCEFEKSEFDVEKFVNNARRRGASIETLSRDLRAYLRIVQNEMIALINDDYAAFVNLSSSLVNLRSTLDKLKIDYDTIFADFSSATQQIRQLCNLIDDLSKQMLMNENQQYAIDIKLQMYNQLHSIKSTLSRTQNLNKETIRRLSRKFNLLRLLFNKQAIFPTTSKLAYEQVSAVFQYQLDRAFTDAIGNTDLPLLVILLNGYKSCNGSDASLAHFMNLCIKSDVNRVVKEQLAQPKGERTRDQVWQMALSALLAELDSLKNRFTNQFYDKWRELATLTERNFMDDNCAEWFDFVSEACCTTLLSALDEHFQQALVPTDASVFRACYLCFANYAAQRYKSSKTREQALIKMAHAKFSFTIYVRLQQTELNAIYFKKCRQSVQYDDIPSTSEENKDCIQLAMSQSLVFAIKYLWGDSVYLAPVSGQFWATTIDIFDTFENWLDRAIDVVLGHATSANIADDVSSLPQWHTALLLLADAITLDSFLFQIALKCILPKLRSIGADHSICGRLVTTKCASIRKNAEQRLVPVIVNHLGKKLSKIVQGVSEVPRQYRWTRKGAPLTHSAYINETEQAFIDVTTTVKCPSVLLASLVDQTAPTLVQSMADATNTVISSVDKMASSLSRLKKNQTTSQQNGAIANSDAMSDDEKIRLQLALDVKEFIRWVQSNLYGSLDPKLGIETCDLSSLNTIIYSIEQDKNKT